MPRVTLNLKLFMLLVLFTKCNYIFVCSHEVYGQNIRFFDNLKLIQPALDTESFKSSLMSNGQATCRKNGPPSEIIRTSSTFHS